MENPMSCLRIAASLVAAAAFSLAAPADGSAQAQAPQSQTSPAQAPSPPAAENKPAAPAESAPTQNAEPFAVEVMLTAKTIVFRKGTATWDSAFETLVEAFKSLKLFLDREGLKPDGPSMTIYLETDDTGFQFQAAVPIAEEPKTKPRGEIAFGKSPDGKALKFVHRGSYDAMDNTYETITNYLDEKRLESKDMFIEEYITDPLTTPEDKLVVHVLVPLK
jgi:effector-binding domain-containing protein